jgi:DNA-directed RNA polymerase subunit beta'
VAAAISKQTDSLHGIKENLIIGKRIPVGTGMEHTEGKYDLGIDNELENKLDDENQIKEDIVLTERIKN